MSDTFYYRLSNIEKNRIAQNLIDIFQKDEKITDEARIFIKNWILTVGSEKRKAFFDVWEIVLKNFLPETRPILFRACSRITKKQKVSSFTGSLDCASRFSKRKGFLLMCDTKDTLKYEGELLKPGRYMHTFYPIVDLLKKARDAKDWGFSESFISDYIGEDEYIMKVDWYGMNRFKWLPEPKN
ncbi:hypothetical protein SYJ56_04810 [Algoriphagus sp. D3-2-R+10]|uniref:hypothetical protein n=1 Tax=Algoriphagus aurantiacus TaxID=3103948 RepID=UPI002B3C8001|nr:hypothetical protein [Algoriphagus sp. D3-2-R+10]MEB2774614.1 hypothetical protein [Algoriphagus sp. D3-2-R+10]